MGVSISFLGLGFEQGQTKKGLCHSPDFFRRYMPFLREKGLSFLDHGDFLHPLNEQAPSLQREGDFQKKFIAPYLEAYTYLQRSFHLPSLHLQWGGDHSVAVAACGAFLSHHPHGKVVWIDAHADMNIPEASPTGSFHGMPLAALMNLGGFGARTFPWLKNHLNPKNLLLLGVRDLDPFEKNTLQELGIQAYSAEQLRLMSAQAVTKLIHDFAKNDPLHVSFDIDSVDPEHASATGVPVDDGFRPTELLVLGHALRRCPGLFSLDIVEVNPLLGSGPEVRETMRTALRFLESIYLPKKGVHHERTAQQLSRFHAPAL